jgi:uncharacterized repeat protein (TIGR01451 family)
LKKLRLYSLFLTLLFNSQLSAQLEVGQTAPEFVITDINGNEHSLYGYLNQGYTVVLEFAATWNAVAWDYHNTNALNEVYNSYGPEGTDEFMVLMLETDPTTGLDELEGNSENTWGDWVSITDYPIIDGAEGIVDQFEGPPPNRIYVICPSGVIVMVEAVDIDSVIDFYPSDCCAGDYANDPAIAADLDYIDGCEAAGVIFTLRNSGTSDLTECTIDVAVNGEPEASVEWTGNLAGCELEDVEVELPDAISGDLIEVSIVSADEYEANNTTTGLFEGYSTGGTHIRLELLTDDYPGETSWDILDDEGNMVAENLQSYILEQTLHSEDIYLPIEGCYTFRLHDMFGDGLFGSQFGNADGSCHVYFVNDDGTPGEDLISYNGDYNFVTLDRSIDAEYLSELIVSGYVFNDANENGVMDNSEQGIPNIQVTLDGQITWSGEDGIYSFDDLLDPQLLSVEYDPQVWLTATTSTAYDLGDVVQYSFNFGLSTSDPLYSGSISYYETGLHLCEQAENLVVTLTNTGNSVIDATVAFTLDPLFTILETDPEAFDITDNTVTWDIEDLPTGQSVYLSVFATAPDWESMGETIVMQVDMEIFDEVGDLADADNISHESILVCSYDPNDKQVFPEGEGDDHEVMVGSTLEYIVRFQNTGNWFATDITVTDPLSEELDWSTFEMINSSHYCIPTLNMETGEVDFYFPEIMLPDSTTNEPESHGFVAFRIEHVEDISLPTLIENTAYIYFDSNPAVVTNTAWTTIDDLTIEIDESDATSMRLVPNPARNAFTISSDFAQANITISTIGGSLVWSGFQSLSEPINISDLAPGAYLVQVSNGQIALQELLIKE